MKRLKMLVGAVVLFALVTTNVWQATTSLKGSSLNVSDIENVAEGWEWNNFLDWFGQGLRADEIVNSTPCYCEHKARNVKIIVKDPNGNEYTVETSGGSSYSFNSTVVRCDPQGNENCTRRKCCD